MTLEALKPLTVLAGTPVSDEVLSDIKDLYTNPAREEELDGSHEAEGFNLSSLDLRRGFVQAVNHKDQRLVVVVGSLDAEDSPTVEAAFEGYADREASRQDVFRYFLGKVLEYDEIAEMTGWKLDVVLLTRVVVNYCIRTHYDGRIEVQGAEEIHDAYGLFSEMANRLVYDLDVDYDVPGIGKNVALRLFIRGFIQREAAQALIRKARHTLHLAADGLVYLDGLEETEHSTNYSELARGLYTDRPNLVKLRGKSGTDFSALAKVEL